MPQPSLRHLWLRSVLWITAAVAGLIFVIILLSKWENAKNEPFLDNPTLIIVAVVGAVGTLGAALLPPLIRTQRDAAETRDHVANNHIKPDGSAINLREEQDDRHHELKNLIIRQGARFERSLEGMRDDIRRNADEHIRLREDVSDVRDGLTEHLEESREVIAELRGEVSSLHQYNASLEDTIPSRKDTEE